MGCLGIKTELLPVFREDIEVTMRSECGDTSGWDNSSCGICGDPLSVVDTPPKNRPSRSCSKTSDITGSENVRVQHFR